MHTYILITHTPCPIRDGVVAARTCRVGKYICVIFTIFTKEQADGWMATTFGDTGSEKGEAMGHISLFVTSASGMLGMLASRYLSWRLEIGIEIEINDTFMERPLAVGFLCACCCCCCCATLYNVSLALGISRLHCLVSYVPCIAQAETSTHVELSFRHSSIRLLCQQKQSELFVRKTRAQT